MNMRAAQKLLLAICMAAYLVALPSPAFAAVAVSSVSPGLLPLNNGGAISIQGKEFTYGAQVSLEEYGPLDTRFINSETLSAIVPASLSAGTYTLRVTNPDGSWSNLYNALTISSAPATPLILEPAQTASPPALADRPLVVIDSYTIDRELVIPGETFKLNLKLINRGREYATNVIVSFQAGDFVPQQTGGVLAVKEMDPGEKKKLTQPLTAIPDLAGQTIGTLAVSIAYGDLFGNAFSESFTVAINLKQVYSGVAPTETPTPTPEPIPQPQLIISDYETDINPLQPGTTFSLKISVVNRGDADARNTSMVVGGGTISADPNATPSASGISGGSSELTNFATLGTSNVQFIGDIPVNASTSAEQDLIVNVTTEPGAYPLKISFIYTTPTGERLVDDQVVTMLVFSIPVINTNFYRDPGPLFAGAPNILPVQVVNLGKKSVVLGNMRLTSEQADCFDNVVLVGTLEAGGYFTLDANCTPYTSGPAVFNITIDYTDDFNHPQVYQQDIEVEILEQPQIEVPPEGVPSEGIDNPTGEGQNPSQENLWQKIVRFFRGLFGLDSAPPQAEQPVPEEQFPAEGQPGAGP